MTTFSQLVDEMTIELIRPDLLDTITSYVNQTIRELHARRADSSPILFASNRIEAEWTVAASPAVWPVPSVTRFQTMEAAYCEALDAVFKPRNPGRINEEQFAPSNRFYRYRTGPAFAFGDRARLSLIGHTIKLSYFEFPRLLKYYEPAARPAIWDMETESFAYADAYDSTAELRATAELLTTNWILLRWGESVVKQGVRAKVFARLGEQERSKTSYSAFEAMREAMNGNEGWITDSL